MVVRLRVPFAPEFNFVVSRPFTFNGREYGVGEEFGKAGVNPRLLQKLHEQFKIDAVIPSFTIQKDAAEAEPEAEPEAPLQPPKGRPGRKPKAAAEAAPEPAAAPANRYRLENNFGKVRIMDGEKLVRECEDFEEAKAAMAELAGE